MTHAASSGLFFRSWYHHQEQEVIIDTIHKKNSSSSFFKLFINLSDSSLVFIKKKKGEIKILYWKHRIESLTLVVYLEVWKTEMLQVGLFFIRTSHGLKVVCLLQIYTKPIKTQWNHRIKYVVRVKKKSV